jgi:hypothetical protein
MGLEGIVSKRLGSRYRSGRFEGLAEIQEPGCACGETRGGGGMGLDRLNRAACKLDPLFAAEQMQQHDYPFMRTQDRKHPDLLAQQTADDPHPHTRHQPAGLRQLDQPINSASFRIGLVLIGRFLMVAHDAP